MAIFKPTRPDAGAFAGADILVPVKPTQRQIVAGLGAQRNLGLDQDPMIAQAIYGAMIAVIEGER